MKTLALLSLSLTVALGMPAFPPDVAQNPVSTKEEQSPLLGDWTPVQGHVEVEDPAPQARVSSKELPEKLSPVDMKQSQSTAELEIKVSPEVQVKNELKAEPEVKMKQEHKAESEVKVEPQGMVEQEVKVNLEQGLKANPEPEDKVEAHLLESAVQVEPEVQTEPDAKVDPEFNMKPEAELESELIADPDLKVELEVKVKPEVQMNLEEETEPGLTVEQMPTEIEGEYEMVGQPILELETLDDDNLFEAEMSDTELSEVEKSMREAFQGQDPVVELLPEEEEEPIRQSNYVLDEEPIMELEPEVMDEPFENQYAMTGAAVLEEGPALGIMGQPISLSENYFPNEEAKMGIRPEEHESSLMMEDMSPVQFFEEPAMDDHPVLDGGAQIGDENPAERGLPPKQGQRNCPGIALEGKCYQFFRSPKRAADAEFFCQEQFPSGHLASITSQYIHRQVMSMLLKQNGGNSRTWVGGLRYLETGRFIWLDGSHWGYADWLSGEPSSSTAGVEDCVELLPLGNGKFNDFTCWEPQAFICSYPY